MTIFGVEIKYPKATKDLFKSSRVRAMVLNAMMKEGKAILKDFESTTQYWVHKPTFSREIRYSGGDVILRVGLSGTKLSNKYWKMVNYGTLRRYVIFDRLYQPKTSFPGSFGTNTPGQFTTNKAELGPDGKFHTKIWGRSRTARRGIRPRLWTELAKQYHKRPFKDAIDNAIRRGLT